MDKNYARSFKKGEDRSKTHEPAEMILTPSVNNHVHKKDQHVRKAT